MVLKQLQNTLRELDVCDGSMEQVALTKANFKGSMRCDANVSVKCSQVKHSKRCEIKNVNGIKHLSHAISK